MCALGLVRFECFACRIALAMRTQVFAALVPYVGLATATRQLCLFNICDYSTFTALALSFERATCKQKMRRNATARRIRAVCVVAVSTLAAYHHHGLATRGGPSRTRGGDVVRFCTLASAPGDACRERKATGQPCSLPLTGEDLSKTWLPNPMMIWLSIQ